MFDVKYLYIVSTKPREQNFVGFSLGFLYLVCLVSSRLPSEQGGKILGARVLLGILLGYAF